MEQFTRKIPLYFQWVILALILRKALRGEGCQCHPQVDVVAASRKLNDMLMLRALIVAIALVYCALPSLAQESTPAITAVQTTIAAVVGQENLVSRQGRQIKLLRFSSNSATATNTDTYRILLQGGLHGNEVLSTRFVTWLAERVARQQSSLNQLPIANLQIDFIPTANPDGAANNTRANAAGVNLNRNFGVLWGLSRENPGLMSFSEPETRSLRALMERQKYHVAIDVHGYVNWIVAPSDLSESLGKDSTLTRLYQRWMSIIHSELKVLPQYQLKTALQLADGGAFEDWSFWENKTLSLCLELKSDKRFLQPLLAVDDKVNLDLESDLFLHYERFIYGVLARSLAI